MKTYLCWFMWKVSCISLNNHSTFWFIHIWIIEKKKSIPTRGVEPQSRGWKPRILTAERCRISISSDYELITRIIIFSNHLFSIFFFQLFLICHFKWMKSKCWINYYKLNKISIFSSVTFIGSFAFVKCKKKMKQVTFESPSKLTSIKESVFESCLLLAKISIPPSVTSIDH